MVGCEQVLQLAEGGVHQQVLAALPGWELAEQEGQHRRRDAPPLVTQPLDLRPGVSTPDAQLEVLAIHLPELEAAALLAVAVAVERQAVQQARHMQRQQLGLVAARAQGGGERRQIQVLPAPMVRIGRQLAQGLEQRALERKAVFEALGGRARNAVAEVERELRIVLEHAERLARAPSLGLHAPDVLQDDREVRVVRAEQPLAHRERLAPTRDRFVGASRARFGPGRVQQRTCDLRVLGTVGGDRRLERGAVLGQRFFRCRRPHDARARRVATLR